MGKVRPPIKPEMKRAIRKRCGFGCVVCGKPIYEYHHIHGYRDEVGHVEHEITLLCPECHKKEQDKVISKEDVLHHNGNPFNIQQGHSTPDRIWYSRTPCTVDIGTNKFYEVGAEEFIALMLDGLPVVGFETDEGARLLNLLLLDPANQPLLEIVESELTYRMADFDVEYEGGTLTVRFRPGAIVFRANFKPPVLTIDSGLFFFNGIVVRVQPSGLYIANHKGWLIGTERAYCHVGLLIGRNPQGLGAANVIEVRKRLMPSEDGQGTREVDESEFVPYRRPL